MPFKIAIAEPNRIVFTRRSSGCGRFLFLFAGFVFIVTGIALLIYVDDAGMPLSVMQYLFPVFGLIAVFAGIQLPALERRNTPDEIIFDNENGRVQIDQQMSDIKRGYIYYDEIEDFRFKVKRTKSNSSSRSGTSTRSSYSYHVYLQKKDGGEWELLRRNSEGDAVAEVEKLRGMVTLNAIPRRVEPDMRGSQKFTISDYGNKAEIHWRNRIGYGPVFMIGFCAIFLTIAYAIFQMSREVDGGISVFFYLVGGFIGIIFIFVIGGNILKMIKNSRTVYAVSVSSSTLDYLERDLAGRINKSIQFPMSDLHAISFSFDTDQTMRKIFIYTHDQFRKKQTLTPSLSLTFIKEMYEFYKSLVSLELQDLTAVEALAVETYLQQRIRDIGNTTVA